MKTLLKLASDALSPFGYQRIKSRFFKVENDFYKLIDFQIGAHGGDYFFVNVCLHPIGLPLLMDGTFVVPDHPLECECILRSRIEDIVCETKAYFRTTLVSIDNEILLNQICSSLPQVETWLTQWASFITIFNAPDTDLMRMLTVIPLLKEKACKMVKCYCALKNHDYLNSHRYFSQFLEAFSGDYDFSRVNEYLGSMLQVLET